MQMVYQAILDDARQVAAAEEYFRQRDHQLRIEQARLAEERRQLRAGRCAPLRYLEDNMLL